MKPPPANCQRKQRPCKNVSAWPYTATEGILMLHVLLLVLRAPRTPLSLCKHTHMLIWHSSHAELGTNNACPQNSVVRCKASPSHKLAADTIILARYQIATYLDSLGTTTSAAT